MTRLRTQIRSGTRAYRSAGYPGDLATELLPQSSRLARTFAARRWALFGGVGTSAVAAAIMVAVFISHAPEPAKPTGIQPNQIRFANWFPLAPDHLPWPRFEPPALPVKAPDLRLPQVPPTMEAYQDLAMQYRELQLNERLRHSTVPTIPADLPTRSIEWVQKVWTGDKSA
jgi:hypothetical protein